MWICGNMSFDFKKYYDVANHLKNHSSKEEYQRSSISRYYYSIFHPVKDYYEKSFRKILPSKDSHSELIKALEDSPFKEENKLGNHMRILRNNRNAADYHKKELGENKLKNTKDRTDKALLLLDNLIKNPLRLIK